MAYSEQLIMVTKLMLLEYILHGRKYQIPRVPVSVVKAVKKYYTLTRSHCRSSSYYFKSDNLLYPYL